jgi:acyl-CoA dehydrogenase
MRALTGAKCPDKAADPIIVHPDVRRMLLTQKAYTEAGRALTALLALQLDIEDKHPDAAPVRMPLIWWRCSPRWPRPS